MFIETHCHLDFPDFKDDLEAVIQRAVENGVTRMITVGTTLESSKKAIQLAERFPQVYATVGIHPNDAMNAPRHFYEQLRELARHPRVVAIGECGLDYHDLPSKEKTPSETVSQVFVMQDPDELERRMADDEIKNKQAIVFQEQLDLAVELGLNVIVHQRDSWEDTLRVLENYQGRLSAVFHCFGGNLQDAQMLAARGHLISFTGIVTFKNARQVQETAQGAAAGSFMVETDCPYLAPTPHRGQRCEPAHARLVAEKIAELRGVSVEEIAKMTTQTALSFFGLQPIAR
ncbi:MAG: TatD family hydrolase [bacterium]